MYPYQEVERGISRYGLRTQRLGPQARQVQSQSMRAWCVVASLLCVGALWAQYPTVFFGARVNLQARADERTTALRWYDDLARHSVVYLQLYHEAGYGAYVAQRLQNLGGDRTRTGLDEAYIERLEAGASASSTRC